MSRIETLISELCENGVKYVALAELGNFYGGLTGKGKSDFVDGNCKFITYKNIYSNSALDLNIYDYVKVQDNERQNAVKYGDVLFTGSSETVDECGMSSVVMQQVDERIYVNSFCFIFRFNNSDIMLPGFAKHLFRSKTIREQIKKTASGVTRYNVSKKLMQKIKIPLPPLSVQQEIVRILDGFSELEKELEKELVARRKQYEYYRDELLSFSDKTANQCWKPLGDICEVTDYVANGSFADLRKNVIYRKEPSFAVLIRLADFSNGFDENKFIFIDEHAYEFLSKTKLYGGEIIMSNIGSIGSLFKCPKLKYKMNLAPNTIMVKTPNNDFYYHYFQSKKFQSDLIKITSKSAMPKFNKTDLKKILIPIPPLAEQERIVAILDKFDALVNDISVGLPAELKARRKQYEYWRNKLLDFKEAV